MSNFRRFAAKHGLEKDLYAKNYVPKKADVDYGYAVQDMIELGNQIWEKGKAGEEQSFDRRTPPSTYPMLSARKLAELAGYEGEEVQGILEYLAGNGFSYCLDPTIPSDDGRTAPEETCWWGVDQLISRLQAAAR